MALSVLALLAAFAAAEDAPAWVQAVSGEVALRAAGARGFKTDAEATGRRLDPGDLFKTLARARAHVDLPLGAVALLLPETVLGIEALGTRARASVLEGEALFGLLRPLDRGWSFSVRTRSALATLESGVCAVSAGEDGSSRFRLVTGGLRVRAGGRSVRLRPGQELRVLFGRAPGDPGPARPPELSTAAFAIQGGLAGVERLLEPSR